jgi:hypothetical protein
MAHRSSTTSARKARPQASARVRQNIEAVDLELEERVRFFKRAPNIIVIHFN